MWLESYILQASAWLLSLGRNALKFPWILFFFFFLTNPQHKSMSKRKGLRVLLIPRKASLAEIGNEIPLLIKNLQNKYN